MKTYETPVIEVAKFNQGDDVMVIHASTAAAQTITDTLKLGNLQS